MGLRAALEKVRGILGLPPGPKESEPHEPPARALSPEDIAVVHLVQALGLDPARVLVRIQRTGPRRGLQVLTRQGKPVRFYTMKRLQRETRRPEVRERFAAAMRAALG